MITYNELMGIAKLTNKQRIVKRSWNTKKGVKNVEYVYNDSPLLFKRTKNGYKLNKNEWEKFEDAIRKSNPNKSNQLINEARRIKESILHGKELAKFDDANTKKIYFGGNLKKSGKNWENINEWNRIDIHSMISRLASNSVEKYLINMGLTPKEIVEYVKSNANETITVEDVLNPGNWVKDELHVKSASGTELTLKIKFSYDGVNNIQIVKS